MNKKFVSKPFSRVTHPTAIREFPTYWRIRENQKKRQRTRTEIGTDARATRSRAPPLTAEC